MIPGYHANSMVEFDLATAGSVLRRIGYGAVAVRTSLAKLDPLADEATRVWQVGMLESGVRELRLVIDADGAYLVDPWELEPPGLIGDSAENVRHAEYLRAAVELAGELGGGLVTFSVGRVPEGEGVQGALDRLGEVIERVGAVAAGCGVEICVRPRAGHLVDSIGSFERLLEWVGGASEVKFAADIGVMVSGGEMPILDLLGRLGTRLGCVYLSELKGSPERAERSGEPSLGLGHVSVRRVVSGLVVAGFKGPVVLEPAVGCGLDPRGASSLFEQVFSKPDS